jgi:hypothetical protein
MNVIRIRRTVYWRSYSCSVSTGANLPHSRTVCGARYRHRSLSARRRAPYTYKSCSMCHTGTGRTAVGQSRSNGWRYVYGPATTSGTPADYGG